MSAKNNDGRGGSKVAATIQNPNTKGEPQCQENIEGCTETQRATLLSSNDFLVSEVLRTNEFQVWFLSEHLVKEPLVDVKEASSGA